MKLLICFALLAFVNGRILEPICDGVIVDNIHHEKEILVDNKYLLPGLTIDYHTNTLFFSYLNRRFMEDSRQRLLECAYVNLTTNEINVIPGIFSCSFHAVDNQKHVVYIGASDGLYEFDYDKKTTKHINGTYIRRMFFRNNLYYTTYPEDELYVFKDGRSERIPELAHTKVEEVAVNRNLDCYFTNSSGMFKLSKSHVEPSYLGHYIQVQFTADNNGNIYFVYNQHIYYIDENDKIDLITGLPDIMPFDLAIESDRSIIYSTLTSLIRLKLTKTPCNVGDKKKSNRNNNL